MALHIHNPKAIRLANELAAILGVSVEEAVLRALRNAIMLEQTKDKKYEKIMKIVKE